MFTGMSQMEVKQEHQVTVAKKAIDQVEEMGGELIDMMDDMASVVDIKL